MNLSSTFLNSQFENRYMKSNRGQAGETYQRLPSGYDPTVSKEELQNGISTWYTSNTEDESIKGNQLKKPQMNSLQEIIDAGGGVAVHNEVVLNVDNLKKTVSMGDTSNLDDIFQVGLSNGYKLKVNWDDISSLAQVMDLFSPEDVKRILQGLQTAKHSSEKIGALDELYNQICAQLQNNSSQGASKIDLPNLSEKSSQSEENTNQTTKRIIVKPDGTRVLVITSTSVGGFTTTTSLKIGETSGEDNGSGVDANFFKSQAAISAYEA